MNIFIVTSGSDVSAKGLALKGGIYFLIRGMDNFHKGLSTAPGLMLISFFAHPLSRQRPAATSVQINVYR